MNDDAVFICSSCGKKHPRCELSFAADYPDPFAHLSRDQREIRAIIASDQCVIDGKQFFIRGCLELPIKGTNGVFLWGLWALIHEKDYDEIARHWEAAGRETLIGPYKGRLANSLSLYPETFNLKLKIQIEAVGSRPTFWLEEPEHPMTLEQEEGITMQKAEEYACLLLRMAKLPLDD